jgi:apolipoprotein N-acyltransferase
LFPALFALFTRRIVMAYGRPALLAAPVVWVATELGRAHHQLSVGAARLQPGDRPAIAQLASLFGVYGLSMLVAAVSAATGVCGCGLRRQGRPYVQYAPPPLSLMIVLLVAAWGSRRVGRERVDARRRADPHRHDPGQCGSSPEVGCPTRVGDLSGLREHDAAGHTRRVAARVVARVVDAVSVRRGSPRRQPWSGRSRSRHGCPIVFGSDQIERGRPDRFFNSAFLVRADGTTGGVYRKMHLVPFGEYVPFQRLLFFAAPLTEQAGTFSPGLNPELLPVDGHRLSVAICYEVVYPDLVRQFVAGGSELLTTITNDAWFGQTSAPVQHFQQAAMRAIENGRYLVRSANTGISGIVDPYGRVLAQTPIFESAVLVGEARFLRTSTFFSRHGDVLAYASVAATLVLLVVASRRVK